MRQSRDRETQDRRWDTPIRETWTIGARRPGCAPANRPRHGGGARGRRPQWQRTPEGLGSVNGDTAEPDATVDCLIQITARQRHDSRCWRLLDITLFRDPPGGLSRTSNDQRAPTSHIRQSFGGARSRQGFARFASRYAPLTAAVRPRVVGQ